MDDAAVVRGGEAGAHLARELDRAVGGETADAAEQEREVLAVHVLHREKGVAFEFADVVDAADVGMGDLARQADFGVELGEARGVAVERFGEELERDRLAELQVVGAIDLAHAAAAEPADDAVTAVEDRAGRKAAVVDRVGGGEPAPAVIVASSSRSARIAVAIARS